MALKSTFNPNKHHKNRSDNSIENAVVAFSLENPHLGQSQVAPELKSTLDIVLSSTGVTDIWLREKMNTCSLRMQKASATRLEE